MANWILSCCGIAGSISFLLPFAPTSYLLLLPFALTSYLLPFALTSYLRPFISSSSFEAICDSREICSSISELFTTLKTAQVRADQRIFASPTGWVYKRVILTNMANNLFYKIPVLFSSSSGDVKCSNFVCCRKSIIFVG